jgi:hypothetical protein
MLRLLKRTAAGLLVLIIGLILSALGVSAGAWIAVAGLLIMFLVSGVQRFSFLLHARCAYVGCAQSVRARSSKS